MKKDFFNVVPTKDTVDYNRIYEYDSRYIDFEGLFTPYLLNRGAYEERVDNSLEKHITEILNGIVKAGGTDKMPPIVVNIIDFVIIDGNSRWYAVYKALKEGLLPHIKLRVIYEEVPPDEFDSRVIELNMGQKSWSILDFIYNYMLRGMEPYKRLVNFCETEETMHSKEGKINPRYAAAALKVPVNSLKDSTLVLCDADVQNGRLIAREAAEIRKLFSSDTKANGGGWYESYLRAWADFRDNITARKIGFERYLDEVQKTLKNRKKEVKVPYGSNKKADWNVFFRGILTYMI